ncbi:MULTISPECIES: hypothetical protein [unclassified Chelatococcus]|uniref:hypothetical protein n=1 Tax=unclassified Chelatococcus TaxID=2638111 RepID=UPI001BCDA2A7|nr:MULTISPECIES: hypothetical protein [unclassified Chelatococcus]MBS7698792.1 hypothetical protein [Chelatococcus sp. YT9]MBX3554626.1 hypothetical protein [Chelatococcus sp.]
MSQILVDRAHNARVKLERLIAQVGVVAGGEYPNYDSKLAVDELRARLEKMVRRLADYGTYPAQLQMSLLRQANYYMIRTTDLLGFITRSTSTRNLFELYHPFKMIANKTIGDNARLILSSDWQYSPFTYPYGLDELPNYIMIGLPASESENALVFPTAGHELGHNIWRACSFDERVKLDVENAVYEAFEGQRSRFELIFSLKGADVRNDMFVQPIIRKSVSLALRQTEELFCDFIGLCLFGRSYLLAFDYLLAPSLGGHRGGEYPDTRTRVAYLARYAVEMGIEADGFEDRFVSEKPSGVKATDFTVEMADLAVSTRVQETFLLARTHVNSKMHPCLTSDGEAHAIECFARGIPSARLLSLGDLINAAWSVYCDEQKNSALSGQGVSLVPFLTDLVIKSAEIHEFKSL